MEKPSDYNRLKDYQVKQIVYNVYTFLKKHKREYFENSSTVTEKVAEATGVAKTTVERIIEEGNKKQADKETVKLEPLSRKDSSIEERTYSREKCSVTVNEFIEGDIRRKLLKYYLTEKKVPSINEFNAILKANKILHCPDEFLIQILHKLGFTKNGYDLNIEESRIVSMRLGYIESMKEYRAANRNIFYLNETIVWPTIRSIHNNKNLPVLMSSVANCCKSFLNQDLIMIKMNPSEFDSLTTYDWVKDIFMPNIPPASVIVLNTPLVLEAAIKDKKPLQTATRNEMGDWLKKHNVTFRETDSVQRLFEIINNFDTQIQNSFVKILRDNGHDIVHMPRNHLDLNPLYLLWYSAFGSGSPRKLVDLKQALALYTSRLKACIEKIISIENEYYNLDIMYDSIVNNFTASVKKEKVSDEDHEEVMECEEKYDSIVNNFTASVKKEEVSDEDNEEVMKCEEQF